MLAAFLALLKAIPAVAGLIDKITGYFDDKGVKDAQHIKDERDQAVAGISEIQTAQKARDDVADHLRADDDGMRKPGPDSAPRGSGDGIS